jgi:hypothetical protein
MHPAVPIHPLSKLAERYDALALARERMADLTFEKRRLDPSNEAEHLEEAQRHLDQAIRLQSGTRVEKLGVRLMLVNVSRHLGSALPGASFRSPLLSNARNRGIDLSIANSRVCAAPQAGLETNR